MNLDNVLMVAAGLTVALGLTAAVTGTLLAPEQTMAPPAATASSPVKPSATDPAEHDGEPDLAAADPAEPDAPEAVEGGEPDAEPPPVVADGAAPDAEEPPDRAGDDDKPAVEVVPAKPVVAGAPLELDAALDLIVEDDLHGWLEQLASDAFEGRKTGTPGAAKAREFIVARLRGAGVAEAVPGYAIPFERDGVQGVNLAAIIPGTDAERGAEVIVVGAHYDHLGVDPTLKGDDHIYNGADNNASGTVAALALARALTRVPLHRTVLVLFFDAGEHDLAGSRSYVEAPLRPLDSTAAMVAIDSVARSPGRAIKIFGVENSPSFRGLSKGILQERSGYPVAAISGTGRLRKTTDSFPFQQAGVPILILHTAGHKDEGKVTDEVAEIDMPRLLAAARFSTALVHDLANADEAIRRR